MGDVVKIGSGAKPSELPMHSRILLDARTVLARGGARVFRAGRGLTPAERVVLAATLAECAAWLTPATTTEIAALVTPILLTMAAPPAGATAALRVTAYDTALEGEPKAALAVACRQVLRGEVAELSARFAPTPPELARLTRKAASAWRSRLKSIEELLAMGEEVHQAARIPPATIERPLVAFVDAEERTQAAANAQASHARSARVAADLAGRHFPPSPSQAGGDGRPGREDVA